MRVIIDRIEEGIAVCELPNGKRIDVPQELFDGAREGNVYDITLNDTVKSERENKAAERLSALFGKEK